MERLTFAALTAMRHTTRTITALFLWAACQVASAHGIAEQERQRMLDGDFLEVLWVGAEHMLTGYDHLLFLFGAVLFLAKASRILAFITAFTIGHTITLMGATLLGIRVNPYLIDAAIALTVIYVALENMGVFRKWGVRVPDLVIMVFVFGLVHGMGLSTRFQEMTISADPDIVSKIFAFNVGVELGQVLALIGMLTAVKLWRDTPVYSPAATATNFVLIAAGVALFALQIHGYLTI
jgi:uncharacterized membrane-anchored protein YitT (DUF2179 family)